MWQLASSYPSEGDTSWLQALGPFLPFGMLAIAGLYALRHEMLRREARADARISYLENQVQEISEKTLDQASTLGPLLANATRVLGEAIDELTKRQGQP